MLVQWLYYYRLLLHYNIYSASLSLIIWNGLYKSFIKVAGAKTEWELEKNNKCTPTEYVVIYLKSGLFIFDKKGI